MATTAKHRVLAAAASAILATAGVGVPAAATAATAATAAPTAPAATQLSPVPQNRACYDWGYSDAVWAVFWDIPYEPSAGAHGCDDQYYDGYADGYYGHYNPPDFWSITPHSSGILEH
ncbi:hypothetical protein I6A84_14030 [Frankia sp. CNm7]|uniref:Uncharacterized protein n=1 Tax=Frankia nepalensis TaxID=1836974 RepID=A0A937RN36_9ACTN|nr:hypothetical protein [Frankia nepalensis]MBL7497248.1 hypothetical protein [Frankia nepalensis]MBL7512950.1 hypothetical protein [Frankia nepalensis]MBL7519193.1 hypothetical protein [Frankia nepalensis]MBL7633492.1 hypothetical protein [Frankia nepalensis]